MPIDCTSFGVLRDSGSQAIPGARPGPEAKRLGIFEVNILTTSCMGTADNRLHLTLGVAMLALGILLPRTAERN